jgi:hypothetical protein
MTRAYAHYALNVAALTLILACAFVIGVVGHPFAAVCIVCGVVGIVSGVEG